MTDKNIQNNTQAYIQFTSPLPPPKLLADYEQLKPGLINEVIQMTFIQSEHRRQLELNASNAQTKHLERRDREALIGQVFAFIIALSAISGGVITALNGFQASGSIISALGLAVIIPSFINGRSSKK